MPPALTPQQLDAIIAKLDPKVADRIVQHSLTYTGFKDAFRYDPAAFAEQCIDWRRIRDRPTNYQLDVLNGLMEHRKEAVRGPRGLGKTLVASIAIHWFALTRDGDVGHDWKIVTTAGSTVQLNNFLWPSIRMVAQLIRWEMVGRPAYVDGVELLLRSMHLSSGSAMAVSPREPELVEGAHAHSIFYLYDEAKSVSDGVYNSSEGAFSGAGSDTGREAFALAISTPGKPVGRFFSICTRKPGFEDWRVRHVTLAEAIAAKRVSAEWAERMRRQWGENSQLYQNHVVGEFAAGATNGVIPLAWLEIAHERWKAMKRDGRLPQPRRWTDEERVANIQAKAEGKTVADELLVDAIGVDCAYGGDDKATMAERVGEVITNLKGIAVQRDQMPTKVTSGEIMKVYRMRGGQPVVDVVGVGGGVVDDLRATPQWEGGPAFPVTPFSAGAKAAKNGVVLTDRTGSLRFPNLRSAAWWYLRDLLDPANGHEVAIPPDEEVDDIVQSESSLTAELLAPTWALVGENIVVESKDELRKPERLGHSTDWADAVVQAFALSLCSNFRQPGDLGMS